MSRKIKYAWWCGAQDNTVGCFHADFDGRCDAKSRRPFYVRENAEKALKRHQEKCRLFLKYRNGGVVFQPVEK